MCLTGAKENRVIVILLTALLLFGVAGYRIHGHRQPAPDGADPLL